MIFEKYSADHRRRLVDRCTANRARTALNTFKQLRSKSISQWHRLEPSKFRENRENHSRMIFEKNSGDHRRRLLDRCHCKSCQDCVEHIQTIAFQEYLTMA